ncbi:MAG: epoxide hydrolase [Chloroflexi bacterium]|nr:epoxide hydrolase [Chloroflexota bacterium]
MALQPFRIDFGEDAIADLHRRIDATRWPSIPFATGWDAGTDDGVLRDLVRYWRGEFDWFQVQDSLNRFSHLRGPVGGGEALHCVVLGAGEGRTPLLLLHGWPGSFIELLPAAELLARGVGDAPAFEVVVPSLPGYGFSEAPRQPGMHPGRIAERMHALMAELGHERYGVQGGDWGSIVGARLAHQQPEAVLGLHLNFPAGIVQRRPGEELSDEEAAWREQMAQWRELEGAYGQIQGTKPQTLAYSLNDSPVGLLAWILEKFEAWSEPGELWETFDRDAVLANVTLYWLTGTALSAARTYYESRRESPPFRASSPPPAPMAFARFRGEPWTAPRPLVERSFNLVRWSEPEHGGHFAAMEQPQLFAEDVATFFAQVVAGEA